MTGPWYYSLGAAVAAARAKAAQYGAAAYVFERTPPAEDEPTHAVSAHPDDAPRWRMVQAVLP